ncbi:hypothetical protein NA78x_004176 [Anatilimnocola sp. NA78]|uniref:hypothetical protein n=1 Tax=Anatilimnocola sp. NA78 TaxID=3415683 RepID=UPI003CE4D343
MLLCTLFVCSLVWAEEKPETVERPNEQQLAKGRVTVNEKYGAEARQATTPERKTELAKKLLQESWGVKDAAERYMVVDSARRLYIGAGDIRGMWNVIDRQNSWFTGDKLNGWDLRFESVLAFFQANTMLEKREDLADFVFVEVRGSFASQFTIDVADKGTLTLVTISEPLDADRKRMAKALRLTYEQWRKDAAKYEAADEKLIEKENDRAANLQMAKFHATISESWLGARIHLAKSGLTGLKAALAADERADNSGGPNFDLNLTAATAWLDWAEKAKDVDPELVAGIKIRAKRQYRLAAEYGRGAKKTAAEDGIAKLVNVRDSFVWRENTIIKAEIDGKRAPPPPPQPEL